MILRLIAAIALLTCVLPIRADSVESSEIFRIRVENKTGGRVQVSIDSGRTYTTVGRVNTPATNVRRGFGASAYTPEQAVAATAVHGLRLKTEMRGGKPMTISLVPSEFVRIPVGYGGYIPYDSGIYTDIPSGESIFRNFAPFAGNPVRLERSGRVVYIPKGWKPKSGDVVIIIARLPKPYLKEMVFENRPGGAVTVTYDDGRTERVAEVVHPVGGAGRYDGTSYTGVGLINTNHGGVVTISTSPISDSKLLEGDGPERRGGFQIEPIEHWKTQAMMPQTMVIAPVAGAKPLEGQPPVFRDYIGLAYDPNNPENSLRVEVSLQEGPWQPMPALVGKQDDALSSIGVTKLRLVFPEYNREFLKKCLAGGVVTRR